SLGSVQLIEPGQLNLMTAGHAISHAEESPADHSPILHGVQLWVALPGSDRHTAPALPWVRDGGAALPVLMGELAGGVSPARCFTPLVGAEASLAAAATLP